MYAKCSRLLPALALAVFGLGAAADRANAMIVEYVFEAGVSPPPASLPSLAGAARASGGFSFDSTAAPRVGSTSAFSVFDSLLSFEITVFDGADAPIYSATLSRIVAGSEIQLDDVAGADRLGVVARASEGLAGADVDGFSMIFAGLRLDDPSGTAITDALVMPLDIDLADFSPATFQILFGDGAEFPLLDGPLTALRRVPDGTVVPLPAPAALLGLGLAGLGLAARRRDRA